MRVICTFTYTLVLNNEACLEWLGWHRFGMPLAYNVSHSLVHLLQLFAWKQWGWGCCKYISIYIILFYLQARSKVRCSDSGILVFVCVLFNGFQWLMLVFFTLLPLYVKWYINCYRWFHMTWLTILLLITQNTQDYPIWT